MAKADDNPTPIDWPLLSDVLRHVVGLSRRPEADVRSDILEAMHSGELPHLVERTIRYLPRLAGASRTEPPPMEVTYTRPIPPEALAPGVSGRGSLHIDWRRGRATRRAGATRDRIELAGIRCSRERMLTLWPTAAERPREPEAVQELSSTKGSRKRGSYESPQRIRARAVLKTMYPEGTPSYEEVSSSQLWNRFCIEWQSQKRGPDRPSRDTVLREVGRRD